MDAYVAGSWLPQLRSAAGSSTCIQCGEDVLTMLPAAVLGDLQTLMLKAQGRRETDGAMWWQGA